MKTIILSGNQAIFGNIFYYIIVPIDIYYNVAASSILVVVAEVYPRKAGIDS